MWIYVATNGCLTVTGSPGPGKVGEEVSREESVALAQKILAWSSAPTATTATGEEPAPPSRPKP